MTIQAFIPPGTDTDKNTTAPRPIIGASTPPMPPMPYRLAIFDFDGTLADSFPFFVSVFNQIADQHGFRRVDAHEAHALRHHDTRAIMRHVGMAAWKLPLASRRSLSAFTRRAIGSRTVVAA